MKVMMMIGKAQCKERTQQHELIQATTTIMRENGPKLQSKKQHIERLDLIKQQKVVNNKL